MRLSETLVTVCGILSIPMISSLSPQSKISPLLNNNDSKKLILIRHGCSEANEYIYREGNQWGDPNFTDDAKYKDAILSEKGRGEARSLLSKSAELRNTLKKLRDSVVSASEVDCQEEERLNNEVLIVTSPLTRTIETLSIGILPHVNTQTKENAIRAIAQPLAAERVYTASDTGRPISELKKHFPHIDFTQCYSSSVQNSNDSKRTNDDSLEEWWYTHNPEKDGRYSEWRPSGENQYYAVPGEPQHAFDDRMSRLFDWIDSRPEKTMILVTHWGVIRYITDEDHVENCGVRIIDFDSLRLKQKST